MSYQQISIPPSLIPDLCNGSEQALKDIFDLFGKKVFNYCRKMVGNQEDAEELLQDVFLKIWQFRQQIDITANFEAFLFTVTRNHLLNFARKKAASVISVGVEMEENIPVYAEAHQKINYKQVYQQYRQVLEKLGPKSREVFVLSREHQLTNKEIAQKMGISVRTVETHVSNALSVLRGELKDAYLILLLFILN